MATTAGIPLRLYQLGVVFTAVLLGLAAGIDPRLAIAAAVGMVFFVAVFANLATGFAIFTLAAFLEALPAFGPVSFPKIIGLLLALAWFGSLTIHEHLRRDDQKLSPVLAASLILLPAWALASALWSVEPGNAFDAAQRWALNISLFPIALTAIRTRRNVELVMIVFVGGSMLSIVLGYLGIIKGDEEDHGTGPATRLGGAGINANQLGGLMLCSTVLAAAVAVQRGRSVPGRAFWLGLSVLSAVLLAATLSRGALLGMAVAFMFAPLLAGRGRRLPAAVLSGLVAVSIGLSIVALLPDEATERLHSSDSTGSGRTDIWRVGWRMVEDRPIFGVGAGNFQNTTVQYLLQPGVIERPEFIVDEPKVPHNIYLQVIAELGSVGLAFFLAIIGFCLAAGVSAAHRFERLGDRDGEVLSRALVLALIGLLAADFFSSQLYSKQLWLLMSLAPALLFIARRAGASSSPAAPGR